MTQTVGRAVRPGHGAAMRGRLLPGALAVALVACTTSGPVDVDGGTDGGASPSDAGRDAASPPCFELVCASDIVSNGGTAWHSVHPDSDHDAPSEAIHDA